ncbi:hypothetical protein GCM10023201_55410 [Actinomycetospora corticicola]
MATPPVPDDPNDPNITLSLGGREITIRDRYETASIVNDVLIAIEFFVGSFFFFSWFEEIAPKDVGVWLFVVGSAQLMIRPAIRLARRVSLRRMAASSGSQRYHADSQDF